MKLNFLHYMILIELIIILVLIGVVVKYVPFNNNNNSDNVLFIDGYYTTSNDVKISQLNYEIISLSVDKELIENYTDKEVQQVVNTYYNSLESYRMYGYNGEFFPTEIISNISPKIKILKLIKKRLPLLNSHIEINADENIYFCKLGHTKTDIGIVGKYDEDNKKCIFDEFVCQYLKEEDATSYVDVDIYCN